jgi:hypothetical protein
MPIMVVLHFGKFTGLIPTRDCRKANLTSHSVAEKTRVKDLQAPCYDYI